MTTETLIELVDASGRTTASISPTGAALLQLTLASVEVMPLVRAESRVRSYAGVVLAPWPNRLWGAQWTLGDKTFSGVINEPPNSAHHGLVWNRNFDIAAQTEDSVSLRYQLGDDDIYPFLVEVCVTYRLTADSLLVELTAHNHSAARVPWACGIHPYFAYSAGDTLTVNAGSVYLTDEFNIPTGEQAALETVGLRGAHPAELSQLTLDHCFGDLRLPAEPSAVLTYGGGGRLEIRQDADFTCDMVYNHGGSLFNEPQLRAVGIEPQTAPANALNSGEGLIWLEPEQAWSGNIAIRQTA